MSIPSKRGPMMRMSEQVANEDARVAAAIHEASRSEYDDERQAVAHWLDRNYGPSLRRLSIHLGHDWLAAADDLLEVAHGARHAPHTAPAASGVGVEASEGATGGQGGAGGLGEAIRGLGTHASVPSEYADELADRADALERVARTVRAARRDLSHHHAHRVPGRWDKDGSICDVCIRVGSMDDALKALNATPEPVLNAGDEEAGQ